MTNRSVKILIEAEDKGSPLVERAADRMTGALECSAQRITQSVLKPTERYQQELRELKSHLDAGRISQETFGRALDQTRSKYQRMSATVKSGTGAMKSSLSLFSSMRLGLLGAGAAAAGVLIPVKRTVDELDRLAKTSSKLGFDPSELQMARFAGEQTGVGSSTMDMALQRFTRRTAEAAGGKGEAVGALKELNLEAATLMRMPLRQQMTSLADAFARVPEEAHRVRLAMKLFDSEGVALVNTLQGGSAALDELFKQREAMGGLLSQGEASRIEHAADAWNTAATQIKSSFQEMIVEMAPTLSAAADVIARAARGSKGSGANDRLGTKPSIADIERELKQTREDPGVMFGGELLPFERGLRVQELEQQLQHARSQERTKPISEMEAELQRVQSALDSATSRFAQGNFSSPMFTRQDMQRPENHPSRLARIDEAKQRDMDLIAQLMADRDRLRAMVGSPELAERALTESEVNRRATPRPPQVPGRSIVGDLGGVTAAGAALLGRGAGALSGVGDAVRGSRAAAIEAAARAEARVEATQAAKAEAARIFDATRTPAERMAEERSRLGELRRSGLLDDDTFKRASADLKERFGPRDDAGRKGETPGLRAVESRLLVGGRFDREAEAKAAERKSLEEIAKETKSVHEAVMPLKELITRMIEVYEETPLVRTEGAT